MKKLPKLFLFSALTGSLASAQTVPVPNPGGTSPYWQASLTAETNKDYDAALSQIASYQTSGGDAFLANLRLAWLSYLKKDYKSAAQHYDEAERLRPSAINPLLGLMYVSVAAGDSAAIEKSAENVLHVDPLNYQAQMLAAARQYSAKSYAMALASYRRVLTYYPDDLTALSGEAWSLYYLGRTKEATTDFHLLLGINSSDTWAQRGLQLCEEGKPTD
jgi:tetratricopeptide (TPR) repeat protein